MIFLIPAALSSFACIVYKIGLLGAKVRQRRKEDSLSDHKGYLASYLKRAQNRSLKALQGGISRGLSNVTQGMTAISTQLSLGVTLTKPQVLPIPVSSDDELDRNGQKSSAALATEQNAPERTAVKLRASAPRYDACACVCSTICCCAYMACTAVDVL